MFKNLNQNLISEGSSLKLNTILFKGNKSDKISEISYETLLNRT